MGNISGNDFEDNLATASGFPIISKSTSPRPFEHNRRVLNDEGPPDPTDVKTKKD